MATKIRRGSGNVFKDLGVAPEEATNLQLRSDLMIELRKRLSALAVTQAQAAKLLAVSQRRVSDLLRGKIDRFSVDTLIKFVGRAGADVRVIVRSRSRAA
jgi:predicted XRE-type DNA-binding protein